MYNSMSTSITAENILKIMQIRTNLFVKAWPYRFSSRIQLKFWINKYITKSKIYRLKKTHDGYTKTETKLRELMWREIINVNSFLYLRVDLAEPVI